MCLLFLSSAVTCGEETDEGIDDDGGPTLVIGEGNIFATTEVSVPSGGTITIINNDGDPHTITSESAEGAFDNSGDFDSLVASESQSLLTLSEYPPGTILLFYCRFHAGMMNPADGRIIIE